VAEDGLEDVVLVDGGRLEDVVLEDVVLEDVVLEDVVLVEVVLVLVADDDVVSR